MAPVEVGPLKRVTSDYSSEHIHKRIFKDNAMAYVAGCLLKKTFQKHKCEKIATPADESGELEKEVASWTLTLSVCFQKSMAEVARCLFLRKDMRKANSQDQPASVKRKSPRKRCAATDTDKQSMVKKNVAEDDNDSSTPTVHVSMKFELLTREADVRFYTGFLSCETFKVIFDHLAPKAHIMLYWEGPKNSNIDTPTTGYKHRIDTVLLGSNLPKIIPPINRKGPARKLSLEQEFLMTMVRL
eukprot:gene5720-10973_t